MSTSRHEITCWRCKTTHVIDVPDDGHAEWGQGMPIQDALPELSAGEREMLLSGTCDPCFDEMFPVTEEEDDDDD